MLLDLWLLFGLEPPAVVGPPAQITLQGAAYVELLAGGQAHAELVLAGAAHAELAASAAVNLTEVP